MKIKTTLTLLLLFLNIGFSNAQKIKIKKDIVYLNEVPILKSDSRKTTHSFYDLNGNEIIFIQFINEFQNTDFQYYKISFLNEKIRIESTDYDYQSLSYRQSIKNIVGWLLKEKVLSKNGKINPNKLDIFRFKYHEKISEKIKIHLNFCIHNHDEEDDENGN